MTKSKDVWRLSGVKKGDIKEFFFFSSRRRHTRYWRDWSSDVCSSDLSVRLHGVRTYADDLGIESPELLVIVPEGANLLGARSEERRVGKECRSRWSPYH